MDQEGINKSQSLGTSTLVKGVRVQSPDARS